MCSEILFLRKSNKSKKLFRQKRGNSDCHLSLIKSSFIVKRISNNLSYEKRFIIINITYIDLKSIIKS